MIKIGNSNGILTSSDNLIFKGGQSNIECVSTLGNIYTCRCKNQDKLDEKIEFLGKLKIGKNEKILQILNLENFGNLVALVSGNKVIEFMGNDSDDDESYTVLQEYMFYGIEKESEIKSIFFEKSIFGILVNQTLWIKKLGSRSINGGCFDNSVYHIHDFKEIEGVKNLRKFSIFQEEKNEFFILSIVDRQLVKEHYLIDIEERDSKLAIGHACITPIIENLDIFLSEKIENLFSKYASFKLFNDYLIIQDTINSSIYTIDIKRCTSRIYKIEKIKNFKICQNYSLITLKNDDHQHDMYIWLNKPINIPYSFRVPSIFKEIPQKKSQKIQVKNNFELNPLIINISNPKAIKTHEQIIQELINEDILKKENFLKKFEN